MKINEIWNSKEISVWKDALAKAMNEHKQTHAEAEASSANTSKKEVSEDVLRKLLEEE